LRTPVNPIGPFLFEADDWVALKCQVQLNSYVLATNRVKWFGANRYVAGWQPLVDMQNVALPTSMPGSLTYNIRFNTLWLPCYESGRTSGGGVSTFMNMDE